MDSELVRKIRQLPAFSDQGQQLLSLVRNELTSMSQLAQALSKEPSIAANILRIANSSFYGRSRKVSNLQEACTLLGRNTLTQLLMSLMALSQFKQGSNHRWTVLWQHAIACACSAKILARKVGYPVEMAYVCGLLHDLGQYALTSLMGDKYSYMAEEAIHSGQDIVDVEFRMFGESHQWIGGLLAQHWRLPEEIEIAVRHHHRDSLDFDQKISLLVYIADTISNVVLQQNGTHGALEIESDVLTALQLEKTDITTLLSEIEQLTHEHLMLLQV